MKCLLDQRLFASLSLLDTLHGIGENTFTIPFPPDSHRECFQNFADPILQTLFDRKYCVQPLKLITVFSFKLRHSGIVDSYRRPTALFRLSLTLLMSGQP